MSILRDHIVIVDIEATCWKKQPPPLGQQNEIIEVGVTLFDVEKRAPHSKRSLLVKPVRSTVSRFCTKLTTLTQAQLDAEGMTFAAACETLCRDFDTPNRLWISWGDYDREMFVRQCAAEDVPYPFSDHHANLKRIFAALANEGKPIGMVRAMRSIDLPHEGTHHRGHDDAWNIARLLGYLIDKYGSDFLSDYW